MNGVKKIREMNFSTRIEQEILFKEILRDYSMKRKRGCSGVVIEVLEGTDVLHRWNMKVSERLRKFVLSKLNKNDKLKCEIQGDWRTANKMLA